MSNSSVQPPSSELPSQNLIIFLLRNKWLILGFCLIAAIAGAIASFIIEEKFQSSVIMFPATTGSFGKILTEDENRSDIMEFGDTEQAEQLLQLLNSDLIKDRVITQFNLAKHYNIDISQPGAYSTLSREYGGNVSAELTRFGSIKVSVLDANPETAMLIANTIAALVDTVNNKLINDRADFAYNLAKKQLDLKNREIALLEDSLRKFSELGVYSYYDQISGINEQYATAISEGRSKEADKLAQKMQDLSLYGPMFLDVRNLLDKATDNRNILMANLRKIEIDQLASLPAKFIVDNAKVSDKKAYPVRWLIVLLSTAAAFLFIVAALLIRDNVRQLSN